MYIWHRKYLFFALLIINGGCSDWLSKDPENVVTEKKLFATSYGFRTALNGLYDKISDEDLYGRELSFAFIDVLSQQYDIDKSDMYDDTYLELDAYKFTSESVISITENIWSDSYAIISNANNILKNIKNKDKDFFSKGLLEKNMISGEALACRAFMHFDILRIFAPSPISDDGNKYIPYVSEFAELQPGAKTVSECLTNIITDLDSARNLTASFDTTEIGIEGMSSKELRFLGEYTSSSDLANLNLFFKNRGFRLNYYAITALLARVYQYAGEYDKAKECAVEVINFKTNKNEEMFNFYTYGIEHALGVSNWESILDMWNNKTNLRLLDNLIFAAYNPVLEESASTTKFLYKELPAAVKPEYFEVNANKGALFTSTNGDDESKVDIRSKYMLFATNEGSNIISGKWYISDNEETCHNSFNIIPLIRLTEMYYIAAESYAREANYSKAAELINKVRSKRGCNTLVEINSLYQFQKELINDARREWISEGQLFYLYKRLNYKVDFLDGSTPRVLNKQEAVIPIPDNQSY